MKKSFGFGNVLRPMSRHRSRSPHQLRSANRERVLHHKSSTAVYNRLDQCPQEIRDCISVIRNRAKIEFEHEEVSYLARQLGYALKEVGKRIKRLGWYVEQFKVTVLRIQAKSQKVQFFFLRDSERHVVNFLAEELLAF